MNDTATLLQDSISKALDDFLTPQRRSTAEQGAWQDELWPLLVDLGLPGLFVAEAQGGAGVSLNDGFAVVAALGQYALPCPLAETMLANKLLADHGLAISDSPSTIATTPDQSQLQLQKTATGWQLNGRLTKVPWGQQATKILSLAWHENQPMLCVLDAFSEHQSGKNLAREPRDVLLFNATAVADEAAVAVQEGQLLWRAGALLRAVQIVGALQAVLALTVTYTRDRVQFGRPLAKFQAIQQQLASLASETTAAGAAARCAWNLLDKPEAHLAVAAAKSYAGRAASLGASIAHQCHGAIGFTEEYSLHHLTCRLWSWREEFGNEVWWSEQLGKQVAAAGADALWPALCADY